MRALIVAAAMLVSAGAAQAQKAEDYLTWCVDGTVACKDAQKSFNKWFPRAMKGDYQGQRNVAFCLSRGCDGGVHLRKITGCAWRMVIISSGAPEVDDTDTSNAKTECGKLDAVEREAATAQSLAIIAKIRPR